MCGAVGGVGQFGSGGGWRSFGCRTYTSIYMSLDGDVGFSFFFFFVGTAAAVDFMYLYEIYVVAYQRRRERQIPARKEGSGAM